MLSYSSFQDILIESELVAVGSINGVMSGKHYNRSVRSHKVVYEALLRLLFESYMNQLEDKQRDDITAFIGNITCSVLNVCHTHHIWLKHTYAT